MVPNRARSSSTRPGSTVREPQPGLKTGRPSPRPDSAGDAGELLPAVAVPADGAGDLDAVDPANECRNGIEVELPTGDEVGVVDDPVGCSGERRVVLGVDDQPCHVGEVFEDGGDELAGGAGFLDDGHESVGNRGSSGEGGESWRHRHQSRTR